MAKAKKPVPWGADKYADALRGDPAKGVAGLRSVANGFDAASGYDLRYIETWSPYQRRKVRAAYYDLKVLTAQPKRIMRVRDPVKVKAFREAFHEEVKIPGLKVVFVPDVTYGRKLPGGKPPKQTVKLAASGQITIDDGINFRRLEKFDRRALVKDTRAEVERAVKSFGPDVKMKLLRVQVGTYETLGGDGILSMTRKIEHWMMKYDGKTAFEEGDDKYGEKPKNHYWRDWLRGVVGISTSRQISPSVLLNQMSKAFKETKARRAGVKSKRTKT